MGHPNKRAVRKLRCYERIHENAWILFVHGIARPWYFLLPFNKSVFT